MLSDEGVAITREGEEERRLNIMRCCRGCAQFLIVVPIGPLSVGEVVRRFSFGREGVEIKRGRNKNKIGSLFCPCLR